jgi:hypothetical protein
MNLPEITLAIFTLFSILRLGSFLPQIIRIANDTDGARAIACSTWCVWAGANASTAAYALVNVADWTLFLVSAVSMVGCTAVIVLTFWKRRRQYPFG